MKKSVRQNSNPFNLKFETIKIHLKPTADPNKKFSHHFRIHDMKWIFKRNDPMRHAV